MKMKPEYSYGMFELTFITFKHEHVAQRPARAFQLAREFNPEVYQQMPLGTFMAMPENNTIAHWHMTIQEDIDYILSRFEWRTIQPDVKTVNIPIVKADFDFSKQYGKSDRYLNPYIEYGLDALAMNEFLFEKWAKANEITEAYCYKFLNAFHRNLIIRVWEANHKVYAISKNWTRDANMLVKTAYYRVPKEPWSDLRIFMEKFWKADSWETELRPNVGRLDVFYHTFEGWRDGTHKMLFDIYANPDSTSEWAAYEFSLMRSRSRKADATWTMIE